MVKCKAVGPSNWRHGEQLQIADSFENPRAITTGKKPGTGYATRLTRDDFGLAAQSRAKYINVVQYAT